MNNKIIKREKRMCTCCMEEHEVKTVLVGEKGVFKGVEVSFDATYMYCDLADEYYADEEQLQENDVRLKDAYRDKMGILTSDDISDIRSKYGISQYDLSILLGWGGKTITRYESHQVQEKAHDTILKKIDQDPRWYITLLMESRPNFSEDAFNRYLTIAKGLYEMSSDSYLRQSIEAIYSKYQNDELINGNKELALDKVVDMIRYFASSSSVTSLYKVKLMKLMWYADNLSYKRFGHAITGLVYRALPMGAVPICHESIINLKNVPCNEVDIGETNAFFFELKNCTEFPFLSDADCEVLDDVIRKLGKLSKNEIVAFMHNERAFIETAQREIIEYKYSDTLQI